MEHDAFHFSLGAGCVCVAKNSLALWLGNGVHQFLLDGLFLFLKMETLFHIQEAKLFGKPFQGIPDPLNLVWCGFLGPELIEEVFYITVSARYVSEAQSVKGFQAQEIILGQANFANLRQEIWALDVLSFLVVAPGEKRSMRAPILIFAEVQEDTVRACLATLREWQPQGAP